MSVTKNYEGGYDTEDDDTEVVVLAEISKGVNLQAFVDTEYTDSTPLSVQVKVTGTYPAILEGPDVEPFLTDVPVEFNIIILDKSLKGDFDPSLLDLFGKEKDCHIHFSDLASGNESALTDSILEVLYGTYKYVPLDSTRDYQYMSIFYYFYFSPKDISIPLGTNFITNLYLDKSKQITQNRSIQGKFFLKNIKFDHLWHIHIKLKDFSGLDKMGLQSMAKAYGLPFNKDPLLDPPYNLLY